MRIFRIYILTLRNFRIIIKTVKSDTFTPYLIFNFNIDIPFLQSVLCTLFYRQEVSVMLKWLVYQENKKLSKDLGRELSAAFKEANEAQIFADTMNTLYKSTYPHISFIVKRSEFDASRMVG